MKTQTWTYGIVPRIMFGFLLVFVFGIAALFFAMPLIVQEPDHSLDWMITLLALFFVGFGIFITFALVAFVRTRISLDGTTLTALVPDHHNRLLMPHFRAISVPLDQIAGVERRHEIQKNFGIGTLREALSIVTKSGERIGILTSTVGAFAIDVDPIAAAIASGAGLSVTDEGTVKTKSSGLYGQTSSTWTETPMDEVSATRAKQSAIRTMQILTLAFLVVFGLRACLH